jgi:hypothetical protein
MTSKEIILFIPNEQQVPEIIYSFNSNETLMMLKIGSNCIQEAKKFISNLSQEEITERIKKESEDTIKKIELDLIIQKELIKEIKILEKEKTEYEIKQTFKICNEKEEQLNNKIIKLQETISLLKDELKDYKNENEKIIFKEILSEREKYDMLINEKNKQLTKLSDSFEKITNKSNTSKGIDGEKTFNDFTSTFTDFKGFEIIDKTKQSGEGDFHLKFEEFDILADAKNYKKQVPSSEREKIKKDLLKNEHIHFAWLVSLNTSIDKFDKSPIMFEWINTNKCILYIYRL